MQRISYDPGIFGFVKAHRHQSGASLVMSLYEEDDHDVALVYWAKRLHHQALPYSPHAFVIQTPRTMKAVERLYEIEKTYGPPPDAVCDFQRDRVYEWENNNIYPNHPELGWRTCQRFLRQVWREVGKGSVPKLTNKRKFLDAISLCGLIHLPAGDRFFWRKPVILHEIAHELNPTAQHGPRFLRTYINLCVRYLGYQRRGLVKSAHLYGLTL